jgi:hypothetical protein
VARPTPTASRPRFAPGYGIVAELPDPLPLPWDEVVRWLVDARNYWVVTASPDGRPHAAPVWGLWLDDAVVFSTDESSRKARNLVASPEVVVHLESGDDVCIVEGRVEPLAGREARERFADLYDEKYSYRPDPDSGLVYAVRPIAVLAWLERDFPNTATRFVF